MQSSIHKVADLPVEERRVIERLLGRILEENELVQIRAPVDSILKEAPTGQERELAYEALLEHTLDISSHAVGVPEEVLNAEIDEAIAEVRRERQSRR